MTNPSAPKRIIIQTSNSELLTVYIPVRQKSMISGSRTFLEILRILANKGTKGRFKSRRKKLPIYMLAITPQNRAG